MDPILKILEENAQATPELIADRLNRSVDEVRRQIKQLEDDHVILAYTAIIDGDKAGQDLVSAAIEVKITPEREGGFNRVAARIAKFDEVKTCYLMSGGYDLLVIVEGPSLRDVASFVSEKLSSIDGVLSTATRFKLKTYKEQGTLFDSETVEGRLQITP
ncbi:MAG: Lrp/AsnC family transcriptional regulator [Verrucomicrobiota bacterium]